MEESGIDWERLGELELIGREWEIFGESERAWERLGQIGTDWESFRLIGRDWERL